MTGPTDFDELMALHVRVQMGSYFSDDAELGDGLRYVSSAHIADVYWNFAYGVSRDLERLPAQLERVRTHARQIARPFALCCEHIVHAPLDGLIKSTIASSETWMSATPDQLDWRPASHASKVISNPNEMTDFLSVFVDAYSSDDDESEAVGYSGLPPEYLEALAAASPAPGVNVTHVISSIDERPAAVASAYCFDRYAGLYNVGTARWARRRGLGSEVSRLALQQAYDQGAGFFFLQTEADSPVEAMYAGIGFRRLFVADLVEVTG